MSPAWVRQYYLIHASQYQAGGGGGPQIDDDHRSIGTEDYSEASSADGDSFLPALY
jgi:hypothetical protein